MPRFGRPGIRLTVLFNDPTNLAQTREEARRHRDSWLRRLRQLARAFSLDLVDEQTGGPWRCLSGQRPTALGPFWSRCYTDARHPPTQAAPRHSRGRDAFVETAISSLIASAERGDRSVADALFAALYAELHRLAKRQLARSGAGVTIGTTTLLHEAYLDMAGREGAVFPDRGRFLAYAARVMRGLIIDYARGRQAQKRGGCFEITSSIRDAADPAADAKE